MRLILEEQQKYLQSFTNNTTYHSINPGADVTYQTVNLFSSDKSSRGPRLWNKILDNNTKAFTSYSLFQTTIKNRLINLENVVLFF